MSVCHLGLFFILLQAGRSFGEETEQCQPGFSTDTYVFKVTRKILERGRVLGKVSFDDCTGRRLQAYNVEESRFRVTPDGTVSLKRQVQLHNGLKSFIVHTWDSAGKRFSAEVAIWNEKELPSTEVIPNDGQQEPQGLSASALRPPLSRKKRNLIVPPTAVSENQRGSFPERLEQESQHAEHSEPPVMYFPKSQQGLHRRKRLSVHPITVTENKSGPYPRRLAKVYPNLTKDTKVFYRLTGQGADRPPEGTITVERSTGELYVTRSVDREFLDKYIVFCHVESENGTPLEKPIEIIIYVIDVNDNEPVFTQAIFEGEVLEGSQPGTSVMQVIATDADDTVRSINGVVRYRIVDQKPKLPDDQMFTINGYTGEISVLSTGLDFEKVPKYTLTIQAADREGVGFQVNGTALIRVISCRPSVNKAMSTSSDSPLTTHVLNTASGTPANGLRLQLSLLDNPTQRWVELTNSSTNSDGRCPGILSPERFTAGTYKLRFETGEFWKQLEQISFYPYVEVVFTILDPGQKYHIPLLMSPFSYTTYRGS